MDGGPVNYIVGGLIVVISAYRLCRTPRVAPNAVSRHLMIGFVCLGLGLAAMAPASQAAVSRLDLLPNLGRFVGNFLEMVAAAFLGLAAYAVGAPNRLPTVRRRMFAAALVAGTAMVVLLAVSHTRFTVNFVNQYADDPAAVGYEAVFFGFVGGCLVMFIVLVRRYIRAAGAVSLRGGLRVLVAAALVALGWAAWSGVRPWVVLATGHSLATMVPGGTALGLLSILLWLWGSVMIAWSLQPFRWLHAYVACRRLSPLWAALHDATGRRGYTSIHNADFALYRRLIEIRDGQLALHVHLPPTAAEWATHAVDEAGIDDEPTRTAVIEAAKIAAALAARAAGRPPTTPHPPSGPPNAQADLAAETAWLLAVSKAFATSPIPAMARRRFGQPVAGTKSRP
jgi:hypothetical protein